MEFYYMSVPRFRITAFKMYYRCGENKNFLVIAMQTENPKWQIVMYIDPGTGSMLFTIIFGVAGTLIYFIRVASMKIMFRLSAGKVNAIEEKLPIVIFSDDKRYWSIFAPVCRELNVLGKNVVYYTMSEDDPALKCEYPNVKAEFIGTGNKAFARMNMLNAVIVFSTTPGLDVYQWKRSKNVQYYVHIPHAPNEVVLYRMFGLDYYDAVLLSGAYQRDDLRKLEEIRSLPEKDTAIVGIPYMDEMAERLKNAEPMPPHPTTVLLAPSWGESAIFNVYNDKIIEALLKTDFKIIIRPHPQSFKSETDMINRLMEKYPDSDRLEWNRDTDNFDVLRRADILISDFSGVIFDFSLVHNKPVIYTDPKFDLSVYDAWWLDGPIWTVTALERIGLQLTEENMDDIGSLIERCLNDPTLAKGRDEVRDETWAWRGEGAKLTAKYLSDKFDELTKKAAENAEETDNGNSENAENNDTSDDETSKNDSEGSDGE